MIPFDTYNLFYRDGRPGQEGTAPIPATRLVPRARGGVAEEQA